MKLLPLAAAVVCAAAAPGMAQTRAASDYVMQAGAGDLYERQSSEIVLQSSRNAKVRDFARMMIRHHSKSTADVKRAAAQARLRVPPPRLMPAQARMVAELRATRGPGRDAVYLRQQRVAHDQALALHEGFAANGTSPPLQRTAGMIAPVVRQHIAMLQGM
jgi:putative membrane protein